MRPFFQWVTGHRALVIGGAALISTVAVMGAANVEVDYSVEQFFLTWGDERVVFDQYREIFSREDAQVAFFLSTEGGVSPHAFDALEHVASLFETVGLESVTWIGDLRGLREARASGAAELSRAAASMARDPVFRSFLWNEDGTVHVVQSVLPEHLNTDQGRRATQARLEEGLEDMDLGARWALSGTPIFRAQVPELLEVDQTRLLGGGIVLFFVILYGFFGHVGRVLVSLAAVIPAYVVTLAIMEAFGKPVTVITSFIPIVILVVGIFCDTTHLLVHWQRHRVRGSDRRTSVVETFTGLASSCFFTSLTTALGFASLATTGIGVVMDFGIFTALAVVTTFLFSMTLLPALLALGGDRPLPVRGVSWQRRGTEVIVRWARVAAVRRSPWLIRGFAIVGLAALALAAQLRIDTYLVDDLKEDTYIIQDLRWIESSGFGLFQTNLFVRAGEADLTDPEMAVWLHDFQRFVEQEPLVAATFGLPDLVRAVYERPIRTLSRSDIAAALGVAGMVAPAAVEGVYRPEEGAAQIVVTVRDRGSRVTLPFVERVDDYLASHPPPAGSAELTGTVRMAHTFSFHVLRSFGPSIALALLLIWCVLSVLFRSVRFGLLAMIPNVFPLLVLLGVMVLAGVPLKPSTILVFSIAFGIAVDDSIHMMGRFTHLLARGLGRRRAIRGALRDTGPALVMSTLVVTAGFSLLLISRFELLFLVGLLTATTAVTALVADLFLFPALLERTGGRRNP